MTEKNIFKNPYLTNRVFGLLVVKTIAVLLLAFIFVSSIKTTSGKVITNMDKGANNPAKMNEYLNMYYYKNEMGGVASILRIYNLSDEERYGMY
ncbi:MAG: hypothetical protein Q4B26_16820, partial [Eubacteriales bacterium]|nr:hypothetical protein [Eubacteriales bacterium]